LSTFFFFQAEDGIRDRNVTGVQTCALPILGEHELEFLVDEEVAGGDDALGLEVPQDLLDQLPFEAQGHGELRRAVRPVHVEPLQIGRASCRERVYISVGSVTAEEK